MQLFDSIGFELFAKDPCMRLAASGALCMSQHRFGRGVSLANGLGHVVGYVTFEDRRCLTAACKLLAASKAQRSDKHVHVSCSYKWCYQANPDNFQACAEDLQEVKGPYGQGVYCRLNRAGKVGLVESRSKSSASV